jgi:hypothetical protein
MDKNVTDAEVLEYIKESADASAKNQENTGLFNLLDEEQ